MGRIATYSTEEMVSLTGLSYRQLQWWDEQGLLVPQRVDRDYGRPDARCYSAEQMKLGVVMHAFRTGGVSLQRLRQVWRSLTRYIGKNVRYVATDGVQVHGSDVLEDLVIGRAGMIVVKVPKN